MTQRYLVKIHQMSTVSDEVDVVPGATFICTEDELKELDLSNVAQGLGDLTKDFPGELRPMTVDEINEWRQDND